MGAQYEYSIKLKVVTKILSNCHRAENITSNTFSLAVFPGQKSHYAHILWFSIRGDSFCRSITPWFSWYNIFFFTGCNGRNGQMLWLTIATQTAQRKVPPLIIARLHWAMLKDMMRRLRGYLLLNVGNILLYLEAGIWPSPIGQPEQ